MYADYMELVRLDYEQKRDADLLSATLSHPTPANLKAACIEVCSERFERKDEKTIKDFFGQAGDRQACLRVIEKFDIDKFKPLGNYMKRLTSTTHPKNVELLAWLIDFDRRPFVIGVKYDQGDQIKPEYISPGEPEVPAEPEPEQPISPTPVVPPFEPLQKENPCPPFDKRNSRHRRKPRYSVLAAAFLTTIGIGTFWVWGNQPFGGKLIGHEACMYWAEDHYEPISCNQQIPGAWVIALDSVKLNSFKKITRPDTITRKSIGVLWCIKVKGEYEYFTSNGFYPLDPTLVLKPLSAFIFKNHLQDRRLSTDQQVESRHF